MPAVLNPWGKSDIMSDIVPCLYFVLRIRRIKRNHAKLPASIRTKGSANSIQATGVKGNTTIAEYCRREYGYSSEQENSRLCAKTLFYLGRRLMMRDAGEVSGDILGRGHRKRTDGLRAVSGPWFSPTAIPGS